MNQSNINHELLLTIGAKLAIARSERGEKATTVAAAIGVSQSEISRIENGSYEGLKITTLYKLCEYLQVNLTDIIPPPLPPPPPLNNIILYCINKILLVVIKYADNYSLNKKSIPNFVLH